MPLTYNFSKFKKKLIKPDGRALYLYSRTEIAEDIKATNPFNDGSKPRPHMRWHPLRKEWVIYAGHRQNRTFHPPKEYSPSCRYKVRRISHRDA